MSKIRTCFKFTSLLAITLLAGSAYASPCDELQERLGDSEAIKKLYECSYTETVEQGGIYRAVDSQSCFAEHVTAFEQDEGLLRGAFLDPDNEVYLSLSNLPKSDGQPAYTAYFKNNQALFGTLRYEFNSDSGEISVEKEGGLLGFLQYTAQCQPVD